MKTPSGLVRLLALSCVGFPCGLAHATVVPGLAFDRFISIWLENQDYVKVIRDSHFAELQRHGILQTRYYAHTHPSQPNYLASVAGDYFGLDHDDFVRVPSNVSTVVDLLDSRGISWGGYFEKMPSPGYMAVGSYDSEGNWDYVRKHNHYVSFDSINMNGTRLLRLLSFEDFERDLVAGDVPQFVMMSPDMSNDGHNTTLEYATEWSKRFLMPLLTEDAFPERTVVQLTYDESEDYSKPNQIVSLLLGNGIPKGLQGTMDDTFYTHYSVLTTVENNWKLPTLGRYDVGANVFQFAADLTGHLNKDPPDVASVNNSVSYPGFLNREHRLSTLPPPNLHLVGAGALPVLTSIKEQWRDHITDGTPYDGSGIVFDGGDNLPVYRVSSEIDS